MAGYLHTPRYAEVEQSLPGLVRAAEAAGLGAEVRALTEMLDRRDRNIEAFHLNPPSVRVKRTTNQVVGSGVVSALEFSAIRWDSTGGRMWVVTSPSTILAVVDGVYSVGMSVYTDAAATGVYINATKGGVAYTYGADGLTGGVFRSVETQVPLKAGDTLQFYVHHVDGVNRNMIPAGRHSIDAWATWLRPGVENE